MARAERIIDIHNYARKYDQADAAVRRSTISDRNKELIFGYRNACLLKSVCTKVRLIRVLGALTLFAHTRGTAQPLCMVPRQIPHGQKHFHYSPRTLSRPERLRCRFD
jgi:hypothetical protein